ncbi:exosome complex exonuclease rrp6 [Podospora australis]|uniref:Exosome complex exonuclease rrp6 n=1 Tax=Podospora australis TaxID=1536484 RepID=A0AAN7AMI2_9PEZI|nr:exosome complex exonuclease rrp6 [Podospora australis]
MESSQDFKALREAIQPALVAVTRSSNALANEDLQFQRTVHPSVGNQLDDKTERLLKLAGNLITSAGKTTGHKKLRLDDTDDVDIQWKAIVDVIDTLLEKADTCLDEYTGLIKRKDAPTTEAGRDAKRSKSTTDRLDWSLKRANILKPQNNFERKIDNFQSESGPWKPLLTKKPHAIIPLEQSLMTFIDEEQNTQFKHPYEHEIENLKFPRHALESREPIKYLPVESTKAIWVDTYEGVLDMLKELKKATEIAIDLEHHDFRTYTGLLSLMQISTREKDWIVDTLVPWRHKLEVLNEVFADPKIVKVLHGAFMDIIWLQRDLGLYVVGMFDTHHACNVLGYAGGSLAFLLKKFVDFEADKKYQLADWRIRPLPAEMLYYARADTHYLLYIYDMIRNDLVASKDLHHPDGKPMERVIQKSKGVALQRYENPRFDPENGHGNRGWYNYVVRSPSLYNSEQFAVFKALWKWRDDMARQEDESTGFIMSQQVLADIVRILPADKKALWSLLDGHARHLKVHLDALFDVIQKAKEKGAEGPTLMQFLRQYSVNETTETIKPKVKEELDISTLDINELKSERSQFWGNVPLSSAWEESSRAPEPEGMLEIPLFYHGIGDEEVEEMQQEAETAPTPQPEPVVEDEGFTLKAGRKRKAREVGEESEPEAEAENSDIEMDEAPGAEATSEEADEEEVADSDNEGEEEEEEEEEEDSKEARRKAAKVLKKASRKERQRAKHAAKAQENDETSEANEAARAAKKAKKAAKKAAKAAAAEAQEAVEGGEVEEEEAFDYSKASSVLRAPGGSGEGFDNNGRGKKGKKGGKGKGKPVYDPYTAKTQGGPSGVRQMNYERAGRSATFKK